MRFFQTRRPPAEPAPRSTSPPPIDKEKAAVYLEAYKSARAEIIERLKQRDAIYSFYLVATAGLVGLRAFGLALDKADPRSLVSYFDIPLAPLTIYPFLSIFFCSIICQHQTQIGKLGYFCDVTLSRGKLKDCIGEVFANWETELHRYNLGTLHYFRLAHMLLFIVPSLLASFTQSTLLFLAFVPRWHSEAPYKTVVQGAQHYASLISLTSLNGLSWSLTIATCFMLSRSERDRRKLERLRQQICSNPAADVGALEAAHFAAKAKARFDLPLWATIGVTLALLMLLQGLSYHFRRELHV